MDRFVVLLNSVLVYVGMHLQKRHFHQQREKELACLVAAKLRCRGQR